MRGAAATIVGRSSPRLSTIRSTLPSTAVGTPAAIIAIVSTLPNACVAGFTSGSWARESCRPKHRLRGSGSAFGICGAGVVDGAPGGGTESEPVA